MTGTSPELRHARDVYPARAIAAFKDAGYWSGQTLVDLLMTHASSRPEEVAVVDRRGATTWGELTDLVRRTGGALLGLGLGRGSRLAIQLPNRTEFVVAYLAAAAVGAWTVPMAPHYGLHEVRHMLGKSRADAWIVASDAGVLADLDAVRGGADYLRHSVSVGETRPGMLPFDELLLTTPMTDGVLATCRPDPDEVSRLTFTSGTTSMPKAVAHTHNTDLVAPRWLAQAVGLNASTPIWAPSPITHTAGLVLCLFPSLLTGAKLVLQERWDVEEGVALVEREGVYYTVGATPFVSGLLDRGGDSSARLTSLKIFVCGGAPITPAVVQRAHDEIGVEVLRGFGQSEAPLHTLSRPDDPWPQQLNKDGRLFPGARARVDGRDLEPGVSSAQGLYSTAGPHVFLGYYDDPNLTAEVRNLDGWYTSGDVCELDADGYVRYIDRLKDVINRGGLKISALEVETAVLAHPGVAQAAVVPVPDDRLGQRVGLYLVASPGFAELTLAQLCAHLAEHGMSKTKWPEVISYLCDLPTTPAGKIQKNKLPSLVAHE